MLTIKAAGRCRRAVLFLFILGSAIPAAGDLERYVAIDNVCAWPNLTLLADGSLVATIFNRPSHGLEEGDVECWASADGGRLWTRRGVAALHDPAANRMNVAAGAAHDGSLVVLASGWAGPGFRGRILDTLVSRSRDGGRTWTRSGAVTKPEGAEVIVPFGDIVQVSGSTLAAPFYGEVIDKSAPPDPTRGRKGTSFLLFSRDDGLTWGEAAVIAPDDYNETFVLRLGPDRWLAAARTFRDAHLDLFVSGDEGRTWTMSGPLTMPSQHPAHLMKLADGRVLLTYGIRERGHQGLGVRLSDDGGLTWQAPTRLINLDGTTDGGYPATVQLTDGTLVTAYYSNGIPEHRRYHMGVVRWKLEDVW